MPAGRSPPRTERKSINLALQGGGSHGAFAWGVIDRLLEEPSGSLRRASTTGDGSRGY